MLHDVAGGAAAKPFETHHNALSMPLTMRIAPELHLKRLLVGGLTKVFELNRNFSATKVSRAATTPSLQCLRLIKLLATFEIMADLVEEMVCHLAQKFFGTLQIEQQR